MNIYFWNINNSIKSFDLAEKVSSQENNSVFIISEFWQIFKQISLSDSTNFIHDEINKRVGVICSNNSKVKFEESKEHYLITTLHYNSIKIVLCSVHFRSK